MVFTNLILARKPSPETKFAGWIGLAGIFFCAVIYWVMPEPMAPVRPLEVEERETVISTLGRLEATSVAQVIGLEEFTEQFVASGIPSYVDPSVGNETLVTGDSDLVRFAPSFFQANSEAQRQALKKVVIPELPNKPAEIAVTTDTQE